MSYHIYFMGDGVNKPTHGQKCKDDSKLYFKSIGYNKKDPSPPFEIEFATKPDYTNDSDPPKGGTGVNARTWVSQKVGKYHRVKIVLTGNSHPDDGYKYSVTLEGHTLDPRVVPR